MKLRNKLILSCAALAAVATTAVSTTYAWYTSNTDVSASGVQASTAAGSDKLLLISDTGAKGTWGSSITLTNNASFEPVSYESGTYYEFNQTLSAGKAGPDTSKALTIADNTQTTTGKVLNFNIYLMNGGDTDFNVKLTKFTIENTTGIVDEQTPMLLPTKTIMKSGVGLTTSTENSPTYTCNLLRALVIRTRKTTVTGDTGNGGYTASNLTDLTKTEGAGESAVSNNLFNLDSYVTSFGDTVGASDNAHTYYEAVTGKQLVQSDGTTHQVADTLTTAAFPVTYTQSASKAGAWDMITVPAANEDPAKQNYVVINFQVFLNGWDLYCFDAVQGQSLTFDMAFSVVQSA